MLVLDPLLRSDHTGRSDAITIEHALGSLVQRVVGANTNHCPVLKKGIFSTYFFFTIRSHRRRN